MANAARARHAAHNPWEEKEAKSWDEFWAASYAPLIVTLRFADGRVVELETDYKRSQVNEFFATHPEFEGVSFRLTSRRANPAPYATGDPRGPRVEDWMRSATLDAYEQGRDVRKRREPDVWWKDFVRLRGLNKYGEAVERAVEKWWMKVFRMAAEGVPFARAWEMYLGGRTVNPALALAGMGRGGREGYADAVPVSEVHQGDIIVGDHGLQYRVLGIEPNKYSYRLRLQATGSGIEHSMTRNRHARVVVKRRNSLVWEGERSGGSGSKRLVAHLKRAGGLRWGDYEVEPIPGPRGYIHVHGKFYNRTDVEKAVMKAVKTALNGVSGHYEVEFKEI